MLNEDLTVNHEVYNVRIGYISEVALIYLKDRIVSHDDLRVSLKLLTIYDTGRGGLDIGGKEVGVNGEGWPEV